MKHDVVQAIVQADPEAFGLLPEYEPRLGCASTGQLLTELYARLDVAQAVAPNGTVPDGGATTDTVAWYVTRIRERLTGEQLAYRTIDH